MTQFDGNGQPMDSGSTNENTTGETQPMAPVSQSEAYQQPVQPVAAQTQPMQPVYAQPAPSQPANAAPTATLPPNIRPVSGPGAPQQMPINGGQFAGGAVPPVAAQKKLSKLVVFAIIVGAILFLISFAGLPWGVLAVFVVFSAALSIPSVYITRPSGKVRGRVGAWVAVGLTVAIIIAGTVTTVSKNAKKSREQAAECSSSIVLPSSDLAKQLPTLPSTKGKIASDSDLNLKVTVCAVSKSAFDQYANSLKSKGFTVDYVKDDDSFSAKNAAGYFVMLDYGASMHSNEGKTGETMMDIDITAPSSDDSSSSNSSSDGDADKKSQDSQQKAQQNNQQSQQQSDPNAVNPDFKATMDSYEKFFNDYVDFMKKYDDENKPVSMLADYTKMLQEESDMLNKMNDIDESKLSAADDAYYLQVQGRVTQKLAELPQQ